MRFLSLFSGIEAASQAWGPLGWKAAGFSEIEPFLCALLKHYYPDVPNLGDVSKITLEQMEALGPLDLVCGGFPCQDLSNAGKRAGLKDLDGNQTRSGLFFDAMRVVGWARARWLVIENVPGMLSSSAGRDFAAVVGAMAGCEFGVPPDGWANSGAVVGPLGLVEWATLDAQFFGLAQRRKRVFLVRDSGDWANRPPVLLERESLRGDPAPRREAGARVAAALTSSLGRRCGQPDGGDTEGHLIAGALAGNGPGAGWRIGPDEAAANQIVAYGGNKSSGPRDVASALSALSALSAHGGTGRNDFESETFVAHTLRGDGFDASEDGTGRCTPLVPVPFDTTQITSRENRSNPQSGDPCHPLAAHAHAPAIAFPERMSGTQYASTEELAPAMGSLNPTAVQRGAAVRRLLPVECEKLQGFLPGYTAIQFRGKIASDGVRYKALGNSWACNVAAWVGRRIQMADAISSQREAA